jgi:hypothetical protein
VNASSNIKVAISNWRQNSCMLRTDLSLVSASGIRGMVFIVNKDYSTSVSRICQLPRKSLSTINSPKDTSISVVFVWSRPRRSINCNTSIISAELRSRDFCRSVIVTEPVAIWRITVFSLVVSRSIIVLLYFGYRQIPQSIDLEHLYL